MVIFRASTPQFLLGRERSLAIIDVRYRPLKTLIAVPLSLLLSSAWPGSAQISTTAPSTAESGRIQNIAPEEMWKRVTQCVVPAYPGLALDSHIAGTVDIGLGISPEGDVANHRVLDGKPLLVQSAVDAIHQWKFRPNIVQGQVTWSRVRALVRFNVDGTTAVDLAPGTLADDFGDPGTPKSTAKEFARPATSPVCKSAQLKTSETTPSATSAESSAPPDPLREAKDFYRKGDFDHAIQKYQQLLQERPNSGEIYAGLTRVYLKKKDVKQASDTITKGLQTADSPVVHVALGEVYFRQGKISAAELEWVNVIKSGHRDARAYLGLARVRWAISMYKSGWALIDQAHQLDPSDPEIRRIWVSKLSSAERIKYLEQYLAEDTNDDDETRAGMQHYLEYMKARAKDPRGACHLVSKTTTTETNLVRLMVDPTHLRGYGLSVLVNGEKSKLLLDTGASGILINRNLAEKAGVTKLSDADIRGIGDKGGRSGYTGLANSLKIGELEFHDCPVEVLEQRSVTGEDGLIGADVFDAFLVDIDFPHEKLHLSELPKRPDEAATKITLQTEREESNAPGESPTEKTAVAPEKSASSPHSGPQDRYIAPEMKSYTQVYRFGHNLLVPTFIGNTPVKLFLLDTGATSNLISPSAASEVTKVHGDPNMTVHGLSGSVKHVYSADKAIIQFGHLRQENQDLLAFDLSNISNGIGTETSGILGFAMLGLLDIKIDYRDGLIDFSYEPKR
jgi:TonB family protein